MSWPCPCSEKNEPAPHSTAGTWKPEKYSFLGASLPSLSRAELFQVLWLEVCSRICILGLWFFWSRGNRACCRPTQPHTHPELFRCCEIRGCCARMSDLTENFRDLSSFSFNAVRMPLDFLQDQWLAHLVQGQLQNPWGARKTFEMALDQTPIVRG